MLSREEENLIDVIKERLGIGHIKFAIPLGRVRRLDTDGEGALLRYRFREGLINKAQATIFYLQWEQFTEAMLTAEKAAEAANKVKLNCSGDEREIGNLEAYLREIKGNCNMRFGEQRNAYFDYLKAAKDYLFDFGDSKKARELITKARKLARKYELWRKDRAAVKLYYDANDKLSRLKRGEPLR